MQPIFGTSRLVALAGPRMKRFAFCQFLTASRCLADANRAYKEADHGSKAR